MGLTAHARQSVSASECGGWFTSKILEVLFPLLVAIPNPLPSFGSGRKFPGPTEAVVALAGQDYGETAVALVVDVFVAVAPQPDQVVGAGVRDADVAVA